MSADRRSRFVHQINVERKRSASFDLEMAEVNLRETIAPDLPPFGRGIQWKR